LFALTFFFEKKKRALTLGAGGRQERAFKRIDRSCAKKKKCLLRKDGKMTVGQAGTKSPICCVCGLRLFVCLEKKDVLPFWGAWTQKKKGNVCDAKMGR